MWNNKNDNNHESNNVGKKLLLNRPRRSIPGGSRTPERKSVLTRFRYSRTMRGTNVDRQYSDSLDWQDPCRAKTNPDRFRSSICHLASNLIILQRENFTDRNHTSVVAIVPACLGGFASLLLLYLDGSLSPPHDAPLPSAPEFKSHGGSRCSSELRGSRLFWG